MRRCDDKRDQFASAEEISKQVKGLRHADSYRDVCVIKRLFSIHTRVQKDFDSNEYLRQVSAAHAVTARCHQKPYCVAFSQMLVFVDCDSGLR